VNPDSLNIPSALLGQAIVFLIFILVANAFLKEAARWVVRIALVVGLVLAVGIVGGWLDRSVVGQWLERAGDWTIEALRALVIWLREAWEAIMRDTGGG